MIDKEIERCRYDNRAKLLLNANKFDHVNKIPVYLNAPYEYYFKLLEREGEQSKILEIGSGMGENTKLLLDFGFDIVASDISPKSVEIMNKRFSNYAGFSSKVADMEKLPFNNESFDIVCCAGSLSYGDNEAVINEIYRVLKPEGKIIVVDSLNNNLIYRLNRYIHYLKGDRSKSTLARMPTLSLLEKYGEKFGFSDTRYFGSIVWLFPILSIFFSEDVLSKISSWIDKKFRIKKSAFKFVMLVSKEKKC